MNFMINTVDAINASILNDTKGFISSVEEEYHGYIRQIGDMVADKRHIGVIMLAGPSASGKTTTAHLLCEALRKRGIGTDVVSLDNFYLTLNDKRMPLLENGNPDFESVFSLDLDEIRRCISDITNKQACDVPVFDFVTRTRMADRLHIDVKNGGVVIIEGLHALNPLLLEGIKPETVFKLYISPNRSVCSASGEQILSSRQLRLIRRACRDRLYRNADLKRTLHLWTSVVAGERKYLYAYKDVADFFVPTFHAYEPAIFKETFLEMADQLDKSAENYEYAMRAAQGIRQFCCLPALVVPKNSLLKEFLPV